MLSSNAYAITLSKCYRSEATKSYSGDQFADKENQFDEAKLDDYYFRVDFENNIVTKVLILSDEELKKQKTNPLFKDRPAEKIVNALQAEKYLEAYMFNKKKRLNYG